MANNLTSKEIGLLGELEVEKHLIINHWHPVRLNTSQVAANIDLLAIRDTNKVSIQIKTTNACGHSHANYMQFGNAGNHLTTGKSIFNSKDSPLKADIIIGVHYHPNKIRFVIMPVAFAEKLCQDHCKYWSKLETKKGTSRSNNMSIYLPFSTNISKRHADHDERIKRNLSNFEDNWDILLQPIEGLHNPNKWPLLK